MPPAAQKFGATHCRMRIYMGSSIGVELPWVFIFFSRHLPPSTVGCQLLSSVGDWSDTIQTLQSFLSFCVGQSHSFHAGTVFQTCFMLSVQVQASIPFKDAQVTCPCTDTSLTSVEQSVFTWEAWASFPIICLWEKNNILKKMCSSIKKYSVRVKVWLDIFVMSWYKSCAWWL